MVPREPSRPVGKEARPAAGVAVAVCFHLAWMAGFVGCATVPPPPAPPAEAEVESEGIDAVTEGLAPLPPPAPVVVVPRKPLAPAPAPAAAAVAADLVQDVLARLEKAVATCSGVVTAAAALPVTPPPPPPRSRKKRRPVPRHPHDNAPVVRRMIEDTTTDVRSIQQLVNADGWTDDRSAIANLARRAGALEFTCVRLLQSLSAL
jgi:hypothetical protein